MITYSDLREIQKKELEGGALVELSENFYEEVSELLDSKKEEAKTGDMIAVREYENIKRILSMIQSKREEKIVLMALRSERSHIGLIKEERDTFLKVQQSIAEHRTKMIFGNNTPVLVRKVRLLKDIEQYKGNDEKTYGPFEKGKEYVLPRTETEWLLKERIAELIV